MLLHHKAHTHEVGGMVNAQKRTPQNAHAVTSAASHLIYLLEPMQRMSECVHVSLTLKRAEGPT